METPQVLRCYGGADWFAGDRVSQRARIAGWVNAASATLGVMANVREIMTADPLTLEPEMTVLKALEMMNQVWIRHLPVCKDGKVVGMLSDRDLRNFEMQDWVSAVSTEKVREYLAMPVSTMMSTEVKAVGPNATTSDAASMILSAEISALPVVDDGKIVGIVTTDDLLRTLV